MTPEYKLGQKLQLIHNDGSIIPATIVKIYDTKIPNYKLKSDDIPIPLYLSEPVLKRCLTDNQVSPSIGLNQENSNIAHADIN